MKTLIVAFLAISVSTADKHLITYKSCFRARTECYQYLRLPENASRTTAENCLMHCSLTLNRAWDDTTTGPLYPVFRDKWRFRYDDSPCYELRTRHCIEEAFVNVSSADVCRRSLIIRDCFLRWYGNDDELAADYVLPLCLRVQQIVADCIDILQMSQGELVLAAVGGPLESEPFGRLLRCVAIRSGVYSVAEGPLVGRLEMLYGARTVEKDGFLARGQKCVGRVSEKIAGVDSGSRAAARYLDECFDDLVVEVIAAIKAMIPKLASFCS